MQSDIIFWSELLRTPQRAKSSLYAKIQIPIAGFYNYKKQKEGIYYEEHRDNRKWNMGRCIGNALIKYRTQRKIMGFYARGSRQY